MKAQVSLELLLDGDAKLLAKHINLLKSIERTKSITAAAKEQGISYKNAWDSLDMISNRSAHPLIVRAQGNKKNSGSDLSEYARELIATYDAILRAQKIFLDEICKAGDFDASLAQNLQKMSLRLSARNQILVKITDIIAGAVNSEVIAELPDGQILRANITVESQNDLVLKPGKEVLFIFKAPSVILAKSGDGTAQIFAQNQLTGTVTEAKLGSVNAQITIAINEHQKIVSIITNRSAAQMGIGVGDEVTALIKASDITIGA